MNVKMLCKSLRFKYNNNICHQIIIKHKFCNLKIYIQKIFIKGYQKNNNLKQLNDLLFYYYYFLVKLYKFIYASLYCGK